MARSTRGGKHLRQRPGPFAVVRARLAGRDLGQLLRYGTTSVVAQVLVAFAASLAGDAERGKVVGTVMSGLLLGVLLARTAAGYIAAASSWRRSSTTV